MSEKPETTEQVYTYPRICRITKEYSIFYDKNANDCKECGECANSWERVSSDGKNRCTRIWCPVCNKSVTNDNYDEAVRIWNEMNPGEKCIEVLNSKIQQNGNA